VILIIAFESLILASAGFLFLYLATLSLLAVLRGERKSFPSKRQRKFAVIVPAHNEEKTIGATLKNLRTLEYPEELFSIIVIADNCTDATASVTRDAGASVLVRTEPERHGKGYALRWCFDQLTQRRLEFDAVIVVDADSVVSANFLTVMNYYVESGAKAIQSSDLAAPSLGDWSSEMIRTSFLLHNFVRPLGRSLLKFSAGLKGNGMCFPLQTLIDVPWSSFSTNEDLEYGMELLLRGHRVVFAPEAKVFATMPLVSSNARTQRTRWERGRLPVIRKYARALVAAAVQRRSPVLFDAFLELITPSLVNLGAGTFLMTVLTVTLAASGIEQLRLFAFLWIMVIGIAVMHVTVGFLAAGTDISSLLSLRHVPKYFIWKISIYAGWMRAGPTHEWVRTARELDIQPRIQEESGPAKN